MVSQGSRDIGMSSNKQISRTGYVDLRAEPEGEEAVAGSDFVEGLTLAEMDAIDAMHARLGGSWYELLGVAPDATRSEVRVAYFDLMKRFHPDVFWGRDLGLYAPRVEAIHKTLTDAFAGLCDSTKRAAYDASLAAAKAPAPRPEPPRRPPPTTGIMMRSDVSPAATPCAPPPAPAVAPRQEPDAEVEPVPKEITQQSLQRVRAEHMLKQRRENAGSLESQSREAEVRGDVPAAISLLKQALSLHDEPELRERLDELERQRSAQAHGRYVAAARVHERDKRWDAAVAAWVKAAAERPADLDVLLGMVNASCEGLVDLQTAADYARRATMAAPRNADAFAALARVFFLAGRMASARGAVESALKLNANHAAAQELQRKLKPR